MNKLAINPNDFENCQIEIDATHLADMLLQCNIDIQRGFLRWYLLHLSHEQINQLSTCVGLGQAYNNLETLYRLANAELPKFIAKWEEERSHSEKEWEKAIDLYGTPDGRPNP